MTFSPKRPVLLLLVLSFSIAGFSQRKTADTVIPVSGYGYNRMVNAVPNFDMPDTVCVGTTVSIANTSTNASNYYWNFCVADLRTAPVGVNMGNGAGNFRMPVFMDYVFENGNYYGFVVNYFQPGLVRMNFGNSLLNTPTYSYLGNFGGQIPAGAEGIQVVKNEDKWYAIIVGGSPVLGTIPSVLKIEFGADIANPTPTATNWGNIGNLAQPIDLHIFQDGSNWYGFTVNSENNTITRFNFTSSFDNTPTAINLGNVGSLAYPTGIYAINDNGDWRVFIVNGGNNSRTSGTFSLSRLDFGNSLLNTPVGVNLGNPGGFLRHPRDLTIMRSCGQVIGFAVNGLLGSNDLVQFDFNNDLTSVPAYSSLGNIGSLSFPHSISKLFREGSDLYAFVMNVDNNTMTRFRFQGCDEVNLPPSTLQNPPPIIYNTPGTYGINLTIDVGLSTQDAVCKPLVVVPPLIHQPLQQVNLCAGEEIKLGAQTTLGNHIWSTGQSGDSIVVNSAGYFWVETDYYGCTNRDSFQIVLNAVPIVSLGNDTVICNSASLLLDATTAGADSYQWNTGAMGATLLVNQSGEYIVSVERDGCVALDTIQVSLADLTFDFVSKQEVCDPLSVTFNHVGTISSNPYWEPGDGTIITSTSSFTYQYPAEGNYPVRYSVTSGACTDTIEKMITVSVIPADIILTQDTTICVGSTKLLRTVPSLSFCWSPVDFLDNPLLANPTTSTPAAIRYYFTAEVKGDNLIANGDFSAGNNGFSSDYLFSPVSGIPEGTYTVSNNVTSWHGNLSPCADHSGGTGNGNMMLVNGAAHVDAAVWSQSVALQPNTNYAFSAWLQSLSSINPAMLQFSINGIAIGAVFSASSVSCEWREFYTTWNSGNLTSATIAVINKNVSGAGNDFALDDISFAPVFIQRDSVNIEVNTPLVSALPVTTTCAGQPVQLLANGANDYSWNNTQYLDNAAIFNPIAVVEDDTEFIVTGTNTYGCQARDTLILSIFPKPSISITNDTLICRNSSVQLWVSGGVDYLWSSAQILQNPNTANPVATPVDAENYYVEITDEYACRFRDSVFVGFIPDPQFSVSSPVNICTTDTIQLNASGGDSYIWDPPLGLSDVTSSQPYAYPENTTTYQVIINESICDISDTLTTLVVVLPTPTVVASRTNDIDCTRDRATLNATGAVQYQWAPSESLSNANIASPIASPKVSISYIVSGTSADGCVGYDTIQVKVEAINESQYWMPTAFTPNGDGLNDCFGVKYWGVVDKIEFSIFNRWGERVFFAKDPNACWDGSYKGVKQDAGVFVYMIRASTNCAPEVFRKGTVVLIR